MTHELLSEHEFVAVMHEPDRPNPGNPIHSTDGGKAYGFKAALVGGVNVYGWSVPAILRALGDAWLDDGWIDVAFRRPAYPGDRLVARVYLDAPSVFTVENSEGAHLLRGTVGRGQAPWLSELKLEQPQSGLPSPQNPPRLTPDQVPLERPLLPMTVDITAADARTFARDQQQDTDSRYSADASRLHPAWIAGQMTRLLHHSFDYGPAIHTASRIQHHAPVRADQRLTVNGWCRDAYEHRGHQYIVNDGAIWSGEHELLVQIRHTAIYQVAHRSGD